MTEVKICGVARLADAELAAELGAWAVGMVFDPASPRACPPEEAEAIGAALKRRCEVAGVFVNAPLEEVTRTAERSSLTLLQLHGDEGPSYCDEAARRTGCKVIRAIRVRDAGSVRALGAYHVDYHLLDAHVRGARGGTGERFDWELAGAPRKRAVPLIASGGLDPGNVGEAIAAMRPFAVDVASGVEAEPGRKDPSRMRAFFRAAERAGAALEPAASPLPAP